MIKNPKIAILLPCYNEETTISKVISDFHRELPDSQIYVYDNNSTDNSVELARKENAIVRFVRQQGKGNVVRRMFREVEADVYVMVDSDDTYPAEEVHKLIAPILSGEADMVNGDRLSSTYNQENKRAFHSFGNTLVCTLIRFLFYRHVNDVMTGYRTFSRIFVKTCPVLARGFEIETEMTLHTLDKRMAMLEIPINYRDRPDGSVSKLNTYSDGFRVLKTIFNLFRYYRPVLFFGILGVLLLLVSLIFFIPVVVHYFSYGDVPRYPTLIFSGFLAVAGLLSFVCGLILDAVKKYTDQTFEVLISQEKGHEVRERVFE